MKWKPYLQRPNSRSRLKEWKVGQGHHVMHEWFRYFEHVEERHIYIYTYSPQVNGELVVDQPMEVRVILNLHPKQVEPETSCDRQRHWWLRGPGAIRDCRSWRRR